MKLKTLLACVLTLSCVMFNNCTKDPCKSTLCLNGGYCANGDCVCPQGFTGADCSQQVTPSKIIIKKIEVTKFPATDNGAGWDLTSGPDIFPEITKGSTVLWASSDYYQNADPSNIYIFDLTSSIDLSEPNDKYIINLYDYDDLSSDDFMGGIIFTPYSNTNGFPTIITIDAGGDVSFKLYVSYTW